MPTVMADMSALFLGLQGRLCKAASTMATRGVGLMPLWGKNGVGCAMAHVGLVVGRQTILLLSLRLTGKRCSLLGEPSLIFPLENADNTLTVSC